MTQLHQKQKYKQSKVDCIYIFCLIAVGLLIYSNTLKNPFVFDDEGYIQNDPALYMSELDWSSVKKVFLEGIPPHRPIANLSFALNYFLDKHNVFGYHLANTAIHILSAIFLFFFIKITLRLLPAKPAVPDYSPAWPSPGFVAFFSSFLWLIHPVNTQAVTYIVQRMTSLAAMFFILSLCLYASGRTAWQASPQKKPRAIICFAACMAAGICALGTKENTATLPLVILLYEYFFFQDLTIHWSKRKIIFLLSTVLIFVCLVFYLTDWDPIHRIFNSYTHRDFTITERVMTQFRVIIYYISLMVYPSPHRLNLDSNHHFPLSISFTDPETTLVTCGALVSLVGLAFLAMRRNRFSAFVILWFFITLMIESSVIGIEIIYEHRIYLSLMMVCALFTLCLFHIIRHQRTAAVCIFGIVFLFSAWTYQRNMTWQTPQTLWSDCVEKAPNNPRAHNNLGNELAFKSDFAGAKYHFNVAIRLEPRAAKSHHNLANVFVQQEKYDAAIRHYRTALDINPGYLPAKITLQRLLAHINNKSILK